LCAIYSLHVARVCACSLASLYSESLHISPSLRKMFTAIVDEIYDLFVSMWVELFFVACFAVGFAFVSIG